MSAQGDKDQSQRQSTKIQDPKQTEKKNKEKLKEFQKLLQEKKQYADEIENRIKQIDQDLQSVQNQISDEQEQLNKVNDNINEIKEKNQSQGFKRKGGIKETEIYTSCTKIFNEYFGRIDVNDEEQSDEEDPIILNMKKERMKQDNKDVDPSTIPVDVIYQNNVTPFLISQDTTFEQLRTQVARS